MIRGRCLIAIIVLLIIAAFVRAQVPKLDDVSEPARKTEDRPPRQVMVKMIFAEVTHDDSAESVELFAALDQKSEKLSSQASAPSSPDWRALVAPPDFAIAFEKLAQKGKAKILSRPFVLAADNRVSTITAGSTEKGADPNFAGDINSVIDVKPHIASEELIILDVAMYVHREGENEPHLSDSAVPVSSTYWPQARVAVEKGQSVIVRGFVHQHEKTNVEVIVMMTPTLATRAQP